MPGVIGIGEFIDETREDYSSPTTSTFVSRMPQCRQTIGALEEVITSLYIVNTININQKLNILHISSIYLKLLF